MKRKTKTPSPEPTDMAYLLDLLASIAEPITGWRRTLVAQGWSEQMVEMLAGNAMAHVIGGVLGGGK